MDASPTNGIRATFEYDRSNGRRHKSRSKIEVDGVFCLLGSTSLEEAVVTNDSEGAEMGMMKNYNLFRSGKVRKAVAKVIVASIRDVVLKTFFVTVWILKIWRLCYDLKEECGNLMEGVDWEAEWLNAINERLGERLYKRLGERLHGGLCQRFCERLCEQMFGTDGGVEAIGSIGTSGSSVDKFSVSVTHLVTSGKSKVMKWMFKGVKAYSHVNLDKYVRVALLEGLLIARKEGLACVEILYGLVCWF
ncbi:hypothetical protein Tco_1414662 [Tanacetum coccineum]